jgi:hypothetical protein
VHVGDLVRDVHAGSTVFIPAGLEYMRQTSGLIPSVEWSSFPRRALSSHAGFVCSREREKNLPLCKAENDELTKDYMDAVVHKEP